MHEDTLPRMSKANQATTQVALQDLPPSFFTLLYLYVVFLYYYPFFFEVCSSISLNHLAPYCKEETSSLGPFVFSHLHMQKSEFSKAYMGCFIYFSFNLVGLEFYWPKSSP